MNNKMPILQLRKPPDPRHHDLSKFGGLSAAAKAQLSWSQNITLQLDDALGKLRDQVNSQVQGVGAALASTATITLSAATQHITGGGTITTINPPDGFSGPTWLVSDDGFTLGTGGNISDAPIFVAKGTAIMLDFDHTTMLWYPPTALSTDGVDADNEVPAGAVDGVNAVFTLAHTPRMGSVHLYRNGLRQSVAAGDFTIAGKTITFAVAPNSGDVLLADYRY